MSKKIKEKELMIYLWLFKHMYEESEKTTMMKAWSLES